MTIEQDGPRTSGPQEAQERVAQISARMVLAAEQAKVASVSAEVEHYAQHEVNGDPKVRFLPGPKAGQETQVDRVAPPKCEHCSGHHDRGHSCTACGQAPEHDVAVYDVAEAGEVRFKRGQKVVIVA